MKVLSLGHSAFLLEMLSPDGEPVRILGDPWLSDYAIGDLMGRFPRVRLDYDALPDIHGIFISHSHTDHLDPYTLVELWQKLPNRPVLILPQSIEYLQDVLEHYLEEASTLVLAENSSEDLFGLTLTALYNLDRQPTNEDDVMILVVENEDEVFFCESDACLPFGDQESREAISSYLGGDGKGTDVAVLLTTKNELGGTMASLHAQDLDDRATLVAAAEAVTADEIAELYTELPDATPDLWQNESLVRLIGGQGLCYPQKLDAAWNKVLFPITVGDRVDMEREVRDELDYGHEIEEFVGGMVHVLEDGELVERYEAPYLQLEDDEEDRVYDPELELFESFPLAPLRMGQRDPDAQEKRILRALNHRFLPYLIGQRQPPIEHLLAENDGSYVVRVRFGDPEEWQDRDYEISFASLRFTAEDSDGVADEFYWANDLEDYLDGCCDDFSTFCRDQGAGIARRLWDALGMPYLNNDLVKKKVTLHFERAKSGETVEDWVLPYYDAILDEPAVDLGEGDLDEQDGDVGEQDETLASGAAGTDTVSTRDLGLSRD